MKIILTLFVFSFFSIPLFGQPDTLLKKFKYRINNFRGVGFTVHGGSQFRKDNPPPGATKSTTYEGLLGLSYFITKSTDKILLTANASLDNSFYGSILKSSGSNKTTSYSASPSFSILNKWFFKKLFTELGTDMSGSFYSNKNTFSPDPAPSKSREIQYDITVNLGIGTGRLENITDMQNALWLYKELTDIGRLSRDLSAAELNELGKSITKGNNTRILDSRKRVQFLLTTVDDYLQKKGLISKTDMIYFSNLNDILFFAYNNPRYSGTETFFRVSPEVTGYNRNQRFSNGTGKSTSIDETKVVNLSLGFKSYIPSSLMHQNIFSVSAKATYTYGYFVVRNYDNGTITNETSRAPEIRTIGGNLYYEHDIYPNTRSEIIFALQADLGYQDVGNDNFYILSNISGRYDYFISYRTRVMVTAGTYYQKNSTSIYSSVNPLPNNTNLFINAGLNVNL